MLYADLGSLKRTLEIDPCDKSEDAKLLFFVDWATKWIGEILNRPDFSYKSRTEYYDGNGTQRLNLRNRPVYPSPTIQVYVDLSGNFGESTNAFDPATTALTYGSDFSLRIDQGDGTSRSGVLYRINGLWPLLRKRQGGYLSPFFGKTEGGIKVVYSAGYTIDNLPSNIRMACNALVAKMRQFFPLGLEVGGEAYKDRSLAYMMDNMDYLLSGIRPMLTSFINRVW